MARKRSSPRGVDFTTSLVRHILSVANFHDILLISITCLFWSLSPRLYIGGDSSKKDLLFSFTTPAIRCLPFSGLEIGRTLRAYVDGTVDVDDIILPLAKRCRPCAPFSFHLRTFCSISSIRAAEGMGFFLFQNELSSSVHTARWYPQIM